MTLGRISFLFCILSLTACGGGGSSSQSSEPSSPEVPAEGVVERGLADSLIQTLAVSSDKCPAGGVEIRLGIDADSDGVLDESEVDPARTVIVCHGESNQTLFAIGNASLEQCPGGGELLTLGWDTDRNGELSENEVTEEYALCIGVSAGSLLVDAYATVSNDECEQGGEVVSIGIDINADGKLSEDEVTSSSSYCFENFYAEFNGSKPSTAVIGQMWVAEVSFHHGYEDSPNGLNFELSGGPEWMSILGSHNGQVFVGGVPTSVGEYDAVLKVENSISDDEIEITASVIEAIVISVEEIDANFFAFELEKALTQDLEILYSVTGNDNSSNYRSIAARSVLVPAGDTRIQLAKNLSNQEHTSLYSLTNISVHELLYLGGERVYAAEDNFLVTSTVKEILIPAGEQFDVKYPCRIYQSSWSPAYGYSFYQDSCTPIQAAINNLPPWLMLNREWAMSLLGAAPVEALDQSGSMTLEFTLNDGINYSIEVPYRVTLPDSDGDGEPDVSDIFPDDERYAQDTDNDGIADEWELWHVDDLTTISATSDFNQDGTTDLMAFEGELPLNPIYFSFESGRLPSNWNASDPEEWDVSNNQAYEGQYSLHAYGRYSSVQFSIDIMDSEVALRAYFPKSAPTSDEPQLSMAFRPVNGVGVNESIYISNLNSESFDSWVYARANVPAGRYQVTLYVQSYNGEPAEAYIDWITGLSGPTPGDADGDGIPNYLEEYQQELTPVEGDADGDGIADEDDAFPEDASYAVDNDNDGMPDQWEYDFSYPENVEPDGDFDGDGINNLDEYLNGTDPNIADLRTIIDVIRAGQGQALSITPQLNDISDRPITLLSVDAPEVGTLTVIDGEYTYTPPSDYIGWIATEYSVTDGASIEVGDILIQVKDSEPAEVIKITSGAMGASAAVFDDGSLYMWGNNDGGQLGNGTTISSNIPSLIMEDVVDVAMHRNVQYSNYDDVLAVKEDGSVWQWGDGVSSPQQITLPEEMHVDQVAVRNNYSYMITDNGALLNRYLYHSITTLPSEDNTLGAVAQVAAGYDHVLLLTTEGSVYSRGQNNYGQLGDGQSEYANTWTPVIKLEETISQVFAGSLSSFALAESGNLYAWGRNNYRQLGDRTQTDRNVPVLVASNITSVAGGSEYSLFLTMSGDVLFSGYSSQFSGSTCSDDYSTRGSQCLVTGGADSVFASSSVSFVGIGGVTLAYGTNKNGELGIGLNVDEADGVPVAWLQDTYVGGLGLEGFESGKVPVNWRNSGGNWKVTSGSVASGSYALRTSETLADYQLASLSIQVETGAGDVRFQYRTSTESDYDELVFLIDGEEKLRASGENNWMDSGTFVVPVGEHTFEWRYLKDGGTSEGEDAVWLDDIEIPLDTDGDGLLDTVDPDPNRI
jgi:alpha-tubulin suppressor-like RCC1 family protein